MNGIPDPSTAGRQPGSSVQPTANQLVGACPAPKGTYLTRKPLVPAGYRLLPDVRTVRGRAGDGLHAPEGEEPVHRLRRGGRQHGLLRLRGRRTLCSRLRVQPFHGSSCID
jgi:hypothetical protein